MEWTGKLPTEEGHYWFKYLFTIDGHYGHIETQMLEVLKNDEGKLVIFSMGDRRLRQLHEKNGIWYGPLHPPTVESIDGSNKGTADWEENIEHFV